MKRIVALLLVVLVVFSLTGCGKKGVCDVCGQTKAVKTITVMGEKGQVCKDCEKLVKLGTSLMGLD